ncbi:glycine cleavage system protein GcvH [Rickettsiales bacterium]|nr:glycine cleavage system protein GcvH [Rickettsiales bacterium]
MGNSLKFTEDHEWIIVEDDIATIGITEYAKNALGELVYVELPEVGDKISVGEDFAVIESVKAASEVYSPLSGEIVEVNQALQDDPEIMNGSMEDGWIIRMKVTDEDQEELADLMDEDTYREYIESLG